MSGNAREVTGLGDLQAPVADPVCRRRFPWPEKAGRFCAVVVGALLADCLFSREGLAESATSDPVFQEVAQDVGLDFRHFSGATGEFYLPEVMGSGVAVLDYDADGDLDVYFLQGALLDPKKSVGDSLFPWPEDHPPANRLFRNLLIEEGRLRFQDVTSEALVGDRGYGMGAATGDYDNDGDLDLYVTNSGPNVLYRNNGDGTFTDVTLQAGTGHPRWSTSAAFFDYDLDGDLDLFVTNYVDFHQKSNKECWSTAGQRDYCNPSAYEPLSDRLFQNLGSGKFLDVTEEAGIGLALGPGLGVVCADFDSDGWLDVYVANDGTANQLWKNKGDGTFEDLGLVSGAAYNATGLPEAGMGVTAGDFDDDGDEDIFVTHLTRQTNTLYVNDGAAQFRDDTIRYGLAGSSHSYTGFGTEWFDYDNDGRLDLFVANGAVYRIASLRGEIHPYHQNNLLFHNGLFGDGQEGKLHEAAAAGAALTLLEVSRGAAFGDIDNDGDVDIVVANNSGPARLLLNQAGSRRHWLQVRLQGVKSNRDGMGARVGLLREGKPPLWRRVHTDGSYLSSNDHRVHFGLGDQSIVQGVVVHWPGGRSERWDEVASDQILNLQEGSGKSLAAGPN